MTLPGPGGSLPSFPPSLGSHEAAAAPSRGMEVSPERCHRDRQGVPAVNHCVTHTRHCHCQLRVQLCLGASPVTGTQAEDSTANPAPSPPHRLSQLSLLPLIPSTGQTPPYSFWGKSFPPGPAEKEEPKMPPRQCQTRAQPLAASSKRNPKGKELGCCHLGVQESSPQPGAASRESQSPFPELSPPQGVSFSPPVPAAHSAPPTLPPPTAAPPPRPGFGLPRSALLLPPLLLIKNK